MLNYEDVFNSINTNIIHLNNSWIILKIFVFETPNEAIVYSRLSAE